MAATQAFVCDGPGCEEMIRRAEGERAPAWMRLQLRWPDVDVPVTGHFHAPQCAVAWLDTNIEAHIEFDK